MSKKQFSSVVFTLVACLFMVGGCGQSDQSSNKESSQPTESSTKATLKLTKEGAFTFAMSGLFKPLNYKDKGELTGFDVEIGKEIASRIGLQPNPVSNPWETIIQGMKGKKYDAIIGSMTATEERSKQVDFTEPYYLSGAQIFVAETNESIKSAADLKDKVIGVVQASTYKTVAEVYTDKVRGYPSDVYALQDVTSGREDAVITDKIVGVSAIQVEGLKLKLIDEILLKEKIAIAVNKDNSELTKQINEALAAMVKDGTYARISKKWFGVDLMEKK
ncbi:hypothetical protein C2W64_00320 [Brevibacillus laterosporus]|nr:transporter substrate-binding domain-containing protein [Brevibacillus laterosporus]RAP31148.1 hypothetical protein C2W64_00320 [Brevibacillus laterosporus]